MTKKKIIVGLDFDGVVAYNPARLARLPISFVKRHVFGIERVNFFVPHTALERSLWVLAHETSMFPSYGATTLRRLVKDGTIEAHLVTARFAFLERHLERFLTIWGMHDVFKTITLNTNEEQPHLYKERMIKAGKFDHFIEDNWDIVSHISAKQTKTKIHWIYNILDRNRPYAYKYPYLERALRAVVDTRSRT